ncbi:MAG: metalloprotease [Haloarculaceae archaeon]
MNIRFSGRELRDLAVAWLALGLAFTFFFERAIVAAVMRGNVESAVSAFPDTFLLVLVTVGVAFLLHELAHKVVAVRFGQLAEFRADFGMLFIAVAGGLAGFIFAAPGAVYHRGRTTARERGLIALAGPATNLVLAVVFLPLVFLGGYAVRIGFFGVVFNLFLAGFNMLPFGPLDGKTVLQWNRVVFVLVFVPSALLGVLAFFALGSVI